jgi:hypothetical protein
MSKHPNAQAHQVAGGAHHRPLNREDYKTLSLSALGGTLEFYDFVVFVFFANVIGTLFFPADLPDWMRQLQTWAFSRPAIWHALWAASSLRTMVTRLAARRCSPCPSS